MKEKRLKHVNIPIFIPELACPFQCVFCNQKKISGQELIPSDEEIIETIETHLSTINLKLANIEVAFFGGNFTGIEQKKQENLLQLIQPYIKKGFVQSIRISTRPDYIDQEKLTFLKKYHVQTIELGAQSMDEEVLKISKRGHGTNEIKNASALIKNNGFELGLQMMIGLPGDSREKAMDTTKKIIDLGAENTRIYPVLVIKDTVMARWYEEGKYQPLTLGQAINWTADIIPIFNNAGVNILKVGLHPSEGFTSGDELIAGPFHLSFRELVLTEIWNRKLKPLMLPGNKNKKIKIEIPKRQINYAVGYEKRNKKMLSEHFKEVLFRITNHLSSEEFKYEIIDNIIPYSSNR